MFKFSDNIFSKVTKGVVGELETYKFKDISFNDNDVIIDIGAHIGIVSIYLAKTHPSVKIYSFEPVKENYENLLKNIKLNNIPEGQIICENRAVTKDGRDINMLLNVLNSGGGSISDVANLKSGKLDNRIIKSTTIDNILEKYKIENVKLLKIDCEGAEYEILKNLPAELFGKIQIMRGEFHENKKIFDNYDADELLNFVKQYVKDVDIVMCRDSFIM